MRGAYSLDISALGNPYLQRPRLRMPVPARMCVPAPSFFSLQQADAHLPLLSLPQIYFFTVGIRICLCRWSSPQLSRAHAGYLRVAAARSSSPSLPWRSASSSCPLPWRPFFPWSPMARPRSLVSPAQPPLHFPQPRLLPLSIPGYVWCFSMAAPAARSRAFLSPWTRALRLPLSRPRRGTPSSCSQSPSLMRPL
jgi:hypothetical protein